MVAIHWDGAQRVVIKTAWMMPTRKRDDAYRDTCRSLCFVFFTPDRRGPPPPAQGTTQTQGSVFGSIVETKSCKKRNHADSGKRIRINCGDQTVIYNRMALRIFSASFTSSQLVITSSQQVITRGLACGIIIPDPHWGDWASMMAIHFSSWRSPPVKPPKEVVIASFGPCEKNWLSRGSALVRRTGYRVVPHL